MMKTKHRTQVSIEEWQYQKLIEASRTKKKSISNIIRDLITEKYSKQPDRRNPDPIFAIVGTGAGNGDAIAKEHDKFLYGKSK